MTITGHRQRTTIAAAATVAVLTVAGCSTDSSPQAADSRGTPTVVAPDTGSPSGQQPPEPAGDTGPPSLEEWYAQEQARAERDTYRFCDQLDHHLDRYTTTFEQAVDAVGTDTFDVALDRFRDAASDLWADPPDVLAVTVRRQADWDQRWAYDLVTMTHHHPVDPATLGLPHYDEIIAEGASYDRGRTSVFRRCAELDHPRFTAGP